MVKHRIVFSIDNDFRNFTVQFAKIAESLGIELHDADYQNGFRDVKDPRTDNSLLQKCYADPLYASKLFYEAPIVEEGIYIYEQMVNFLSNHANFYFYAKVHQLTNKRLNMAWLDKYKMLEGNQIFFRKNVLDIPANMIVTASLSDCNKYILNKRSAMLIKMPFNQGNTIHPSIHIADNIADAYNEIINYVRNY